MARVGFIGLGLMGAPMAANVARGGHALTVYNRTPAKAQPLTELGATVVASPRAVGEASEVVITMLTDAEGVRGVVDGPDGLLAAGTGKTLIDMSTISPAQARHLAGQLESHGWELIEAPVFGSTGPAQDGTLGIMVGGRRETFEPTGGRCGLVDLGQDAAAGRIAASGRLFEPGIAHGGIARSDRRGPAQGQEHEPEPEPAGRAPPAGGGTIGTSATGGGAIGMRTIPADDIGMRATRAGGARHAPELRRGRICGWPSEARYS